MAAQLSPQFRVAEYKLEEANNFPVSVKWDFLNNGGIQEEGKTVVLFDKGSQVNVIKSLTFARKDGILVNTFYSPPPEGF
jgi:hypothetical protein